MGHDDQAELLGEVPNWCRRRHLQLGNRVDGRGRLPRFKKRVDLLPGRIRESLSWCLVGTGNVFMDVGTLLPGDDFVAAIQQRLADCDVMLVVIGRRDTSQIRRAS